MMWIVKKTTPTLSVTRCISRSIHRRAVSEKIRVCSQCAMWSPSIQGLDISWRSVVCVGIAVSVYPCWKLRFRIQHPVISHAW